MENAGSKIMTIVNDIADSQITRAELLYAKFQNTLKEDYASKIKLVEDSFIGKASLYGKTGTDCLEDKGKLISKYESEFQKIFDARREQFLNIQNEIQEIQANKIIVIANFKKVVDTRDGVMKTEEYKNYVYKKKEYETIIQNSLEKEQFDRYTEMLENLVNPIDSYYDKLYALAQKYDNYDEAIKACEQKLFECIEVAKGDFANITRFIETGLQDAKQPNVIIKFLNSIINKFSSNKKYEKDVVQKMHAEIDSVISDNSESSKQIEEETLGIVTAIEEVRNNINLMFQNAIS